MVVQRIVGRWLVQGIVGLRALIQAVAEALPVIVLAAGWGRRMMVVLPLMKLSGSWLRTVAIAS